MKKQKIKKNLRPRVRNAGRDPRAPWPAAAADTLEAALAKAARIAEPFPEEAEAIENVIRFVRGLRHGQPDELQLRDVLLAASILITALDREPTPEEREVLGIVDTVLGVPPRTDALRRRAAAWIRKPISAVPRILTSIAHACAPTPSIPTRHRRFAA